MSTDVVESGYEIERIKAEISQERQMKEMLEKSSAELKLTIDQLEKRIDSIDMEGNEWKTRFETQEEINYQFQKQIAHLLEKIEETKQNINRVRNPQTAALEEELLEPTPFIVQNLRQQKSSLETQIHDLESRLEQESKSYHKAIDERKQYMMEINNTNIAIDNMLKRAQQQTDNSSENTSPSIKLRNIPGDQRVIDPKRGPIKKTAAVKNLPRLESDRSK